MKELYLIATSNEYNSAVSFSPSELYVTLDGDCSEETYSTRECYYNDEGNLREEAGRIERFYQSGYWHVSGEEIRDRFNNIKSNV